MSTLILWAIFFLNREEINKAEEMVISLTRKRYSPSQNLKPVPVKNINSKKF
jgi:hypothetical protein